ncbi:hypothetical protein [Streptomyces sp. ID01-9D]|nr:hypothetical protein [Streptomyces sp. ID01-9D]MDX5577443.1 hypothetical protein [Streptomyces sp. ID01-9D]
MGKPMLEGLEEIINEEGQRGKTGEVEEMAVRRDILFKKLKKREKN